MSLPLPPPSTPMPLKVLPFKVPWLGPVKTQLLLVLDALRTFCPLPPVTLKE